MGKLTEAQRRFMSRNQNGGLATYSTSEYNMARRLVDKGMIRTAIPKYTNYDFWITDQGRAALEGET